MTIRRGGFQRPRGPRRTSTWGLGPQDTGQTVTGSGTFIWNTGTVPNIGLTVVRTRGYINYFLTAVTAILDGFNFASGIYMMTEDAFAAGDASALDPIDNANSDMWLWHQFGTLKSITPTIADGVNANCCFLRHEIDSKAMRKNFDPQRVMVGVTQVVETGNASMAWFADTRQLLKQ